MIGDRRSDREHVRRGEDGQPAAGGGPRESLDARAVNADIADDDFTQETSPNHVAEAVERDIQMITTDAEKAF